MMTTNDTNIARNFAEYLGFRLGDLPSGRIDHRTKIDHCSLMGPWEINYHVAEPGTVACLLLDALHPLYQAPGERLPDGRTGTQACLQSLLEAWPKPPVRNWDWVKTLSDQVWISQGKEWEYIEIDGALVFEALMSGETVASIRSRIEARDPSLLVAHRRFDDGLGKPSKPKYSR